MIDYTQLANQIVSWAVLGLLAALTGYIGRTVKQSMARASADINGMRSDIDKLKTSQRTQLKASIVRTCNEALERGWIYATELETLNRRSEEYADLGGNTYVDVIVGRVNRECAIRGEVPEH